MEEHKVKVYIKKVINDDELYYNLFLHINGVKTFSTRIYGNYNNNFSDKDGEFYFPFINEQHFVVNNTKLNKVFEDTFIIRYGISKDKLIVFFDNKRCFNVSLNKCLMIKKQIKHELYNVVSYNGGEGLYFRYYMLC